MRIEHCKIIIVLFLSLFVCFLFYFPASDCSKGNWNRQQSNHAIVDIILPLMKNHRIYLVPNSMAHSTLIKRENPIQFSRTKSMRKEFEFCLNRPHRLTSIHVANTEKNTAKLKHTQMPFLRFQIEIQWNAFPKIAAECNKLFESSHLFMKCFVFICFWCRWLYTDGIINTDNKWFIICLQREFRWYTNVQYNENDVINLSQCGNWWQCWTTYHLFCNTYVSATRTNCWDYTAGPNIDACTEFALDRCRWCWFMQLIFGYAFGAFW